MIFLLKKSYHVTFRDYDETIEGGGRERKWR